MEDAQSIVKIRFLVTFLTFVSVIRQNFEYNLKATVFFVFFLIKIILFTLKMYFLQRKMLKVS